MQDLLNQARELWNSGEHSQSVQMYQRILQESSVTSPINAVAKCELGQILINGGYPNEGLGLLCAGLNQNPELGNAQLYCDLANELFNRGALSDAARYSELAFRLNSELIAAVLLRIKIYAAEGRLDLALERFDTLLNTREELSSSGLENHVNFNVLWPIESFRTILFELRGWIALGPVTQEHRSLLEAVQFAIAGDFINSRTELTTRMSPTSKDHGYAEYLHAVVSFAWSKLNTTQGFLDAAVMHIAAAQLAFPSHAFVAMLRGDILAAKQGNTPDVLELYRLATQLDSALPEPWLRLWNYEAGVGRWHDSIDLAERYYWTLEQRASQVSPEWKGTRFLSDVAYSFGHLAESLDALSKAMKLGWLKPTKFFISTYNGRIANRCLLEYFERTGLVKVITDPRERTELQPIAQQTLYDSVLIPVPNNRVLHARSALSLLDCTWANENRPPTLTLTEEDRERGLALLHKLGMPRDAWFVTVHVREPQFKNEGNSVFNAYRNSNIANYGEAMKEIVSRGGWVVRLGTAQSADLPVLPQVIDYARSGMRSDWMDVFLMGASRFVLATGSGVSITPGAFGTPLVATDYPPQTPRQYSNDTIYLPKLIQRDGDGTLLPFSASFNAPYYGFDDGEAFHKMGIRFIDNSAEELAAVVREMLDKLDKTLRYTKEDEELQDRYRVLLNPSNGTFVSRIGRDFLKKYAHLL